MLMTSGTICTTVWASDSEEEEKNDEANSGGEEELEAELARENEAPRPKQRNMTDISPLIDCMSSSGASERDTTAMANAMHEADGINLAEHPELIVTKSKVHVAKKSRLEQLSGAPAEPTDAIYIDGKRYKTLHGEEVEDLFTRLYNPLCRSVRPSHYFFIVL